MFKRKNRHKEQSTPDREQILETATDAAALVLREAITKDVLKVYGYEEDDFTRGLKDVLGRFETPPEPRVLYPGSSTHMGVAYVFGKDHVTHVDPSKEACDILKEEGCNALESTFEALRTDELFDIIVALNSYGAPDPETLARVLMPNALIIANNYSHWAKELEDLSVVRLEGALFPAYDGQSDSRYLDADELPPDATEISKIYYQITREGKVSTGTPEQYTFADLEPRYPDALFAFRYKPVKQHG